MVELNGSGLAGEFAALIGADRVRAPRGRESAVANLVLEPAQVEEIGEIVRKCERDHIALAPIGAARTLLRREPLPVAISLARINRVVAYEPDDMTVVAEAGVALGELNRIAAEHGQRLPVDPPHAELTTIGSLIAGAQAGPIRLSEGTVRDLLLGIRFVGHDGRLIRAGGRVVKNVAGYDLMKVLTGSHGTLGIIVEAAFKVRPIPLNYTLAISSFARITDAFAAARQADQAAQLFHCEVLGGSLAAPFVESGQFALLAGFGGLRAEVEHQRAQLVAALGDGLRMLTEADAVIAYQQLCDPPLKDMAIAARIAVLPAELGRCIEACGADFRAHALSGVAQLFSAEEAPSNDASDRIARWRAIARSARGHLRVIVAPPHLRANLALFDTPPAPAMALMRRLKTSFDPHNIFNPHSFVGGL
jgi:glycolate oxidase FAD binding subunit